jgi:CRISPR-associated endonuclease/helicase Cas3
MAQFDLQFFRAFFRGIHDRDPFPWQERLADQTVSDGWPAVIDLPTASGKTACVDIALFALACGTGFRRIFFVVDRKVIVDEAFEGRKRVAERIASAKDGALGEVGQRLRALAAGDEPVRVTQLRGGIYRDESWVRNPLQPTIVASTVDQIGSRLLFRGYGVSASSQPIHAGLIGNDALVLLDEAHCSRAFAQTLERVERYRSGGRLGLPFAFVEMTATPSRGSVAKRFQLNEADRENETMLRRLRGSKLTRYVVAKAKTEEARKLASDLVREARALASRQELRRIAVMVNRVETAKEVAAALEGEDVTVVLGRMRPVDREEAETNLAGVRTGVRRTPDEPLRFVVSTQCLEVGADLDFDGLVTELASIDALLQRFGRLNRLGGLEGGARGCIVAPTADAKRVDPIYGEGLTKTREWLTVLFAEQEEREFALEADGQSVPELWRALPEQTRQEMTPKTPVCATLLPTHMDVLAQTNPRPAPEPAVSYFLHGRQEQAGEVHVVWRSDFGQDAEQWAALASLCPATVAESLPVKLWAFRAWMDGEKPRGQSDLEGDEGPDREGGKRRNVAECAVLLWRGNTGIVATNSREIVPGDTVYLPLSAWPAEELGYIPKGAPADVADEAYHTTRGMLRLRLHLGPMENWPESARGALAKLIREATLSGELDWELLRSTAAQTVREAAETLPPWLRKGLEAIATQERRLFTVTAYPKDNAGWLVESKLRLAQMAEDTGWDDGSRGEAVSLQEHTADVVVQAERLSAALGDTSLARAVARAAEWHDSGKADERFQKLLFGGDAMAALLSPVLRAKGEFARLSDRLAQAERSSLPKGFRHELISLLLTEKGLGTGELERELVLHLVATHHGYCRPLAPVVLDSTPAALCYGDVELSAEARLSGAAHRLDAGVADRYWKLTRRFGWWGLAYLESVLRLADWTASSAEQKRLTEGLKEEQN